jgi:hypothetical protein
MKTTKIVIGQIILDSSNYAIIWGYILDDQTFRRCDFVISWDKLNEIIRNGGANGVRLEDEILIKLPLVESGPEMIDLEAKHGAALVFENMEFVLRPAQGHNKEWVNETTLSIDDVLTSK